MCGVNDIEVQSCAEQDRRNLYEPFTIDDFAKSHPNEECGKASDAVHQKLRGEATLLSRI
jgi:hypothetical protein